MSGLWVRGVEPPVDVTDVNAVSGTGALNGIPFMGMLLYSKTGIAQTCARRHLGAFERISGNHRKS
jgi:hypothetical protein